MTHPRPIRKLAPLLALLWLWHLAIACDNSEESRLPPLDNNNSSNNSSNSSNNSSNNDNSGNNANNNVDDRPPGNVTADTSFNLSGDVRSQCSNGQPYVPFGSTQRQYAAGSALPDLSFSRMSENVAAFYDTWKAKYLGNSSACGNDRYFVNAILDNRISVSEGHGYGMLIMAYMAGHEPLAQQYFDGMVRYYQDHPSGINDALMSWAQNSSCNNVDGNASATDGDMDMAYALLLAHKQWGSSGAINYLQLGERMVDAIMADEVSHDGRWLLLGDWVSTGAKYDATRPSDFMPGHMATFELLKGDGAWRTLRNGTYNVMAQFQNQYAANSGLFPDFMVNISGTPAPAAASFHESPNDGNYYYNACRVPWRLATDYLTTGNNTSRDLLARINYFIRQKTGEVPSDIAVGYRLDGAAIETSYTSWAFIAPFGPGAMVNAGNQHWINTVWNHLVSNKWEEAYYEDTIKLLSMIVMSGNWWAPQDIDC
ncbi:MAG: glycosyl hydrolase family 8 [Proteobacteria bacterium]|nr:glycosyl hydrolase family 8 [Pseudomonadota bacterium]